MSETNEDPKRPLPDQRHTGVSCEHAIGCDAQIGEQRR
jgi:hypothetical protein